MPDFLRNIDNDRQGDNQAPGKFRSETNVSYPVKSRFTFEFGIISLLIVVAGIVAVTGWLAYDRFTSLVASVDEAARPDMQLLAMEKVWNNLSEAETTVKSYSITREDAYLTRFYETAQRTDTQMQELYSFLADDPGTEHYLDSLNKLVDEKFEILTDLLVLKNRNRAQQALEQFMAKVEEQNAQQDTATTTSQETVTVQLDTTDTLASTEPEQEEKKKGFFGQVLDKVGQVFKKKPEEPEPQPEPVVTTTAVDTANQADTSEPRAQLTVAELNNALEQVRKEEASRQAWLSHRELNLWEEDGEVTARIRELFNEMKAEENKVMAAEARQAESDVLQTNRIILAFVVVAALLLMIAAFIIVTYVRNNRKYRKALARAKTKAEDLASAKERFLANMSHEIRTPMNAIAGFSEQLGQSKLTKKQREQLEIVQKSAGHLLHIVNDVLDLTKLRSGRLKFESIGFGPGAIVREVTKLMEPGARDKGIELNAKVDPEIPKVVIGDPVRLRQILLNLVGNAVKFTQVGSVLIRLELEKSRGKKVRLHFSVIDTGIGIDQANRDRIFEDFEQGEISTTRYYGGTGLGLSITRMLVEAQKGSIEVESAVGQGTTVSFTIPYKVGAADDIQEAAPVQVGALPEGLRGLVVDDEPFNRKLLRAILQKHKVECVETDNGKRAVQLVDQDEFDFVLMDARMPELNGVDATRHIRKMGNDIPVIALTAAITPEDQKAYEAAGMNAILGKPFKEHELILAISRLLDGKDNGMPQPPADEANQAPGKFDVNELKRLSGGDEQFFHEMLETYITSAQEGRTKIREAFEQKNWEEMADAAHKLCPPSRHLDAHEFLRCLQAIEQIGRSEQELDRLPDLIDCMETEATAVIEGIRQSDYFKQEA